MRLVQVKASQRSGCCHSAQADGSAACTEQVPPSFPSLSSKQVQAVTEVITKHIFTPADSMFSSNHRHICHSLFAFKWLTYLCTFFDLISFLKTARKTYQQFAQISKGEAVLHSPYEPCRSLTQLYLRDTHRPAELISRGQAQSLTGLTT